MEKKKHIAIIPARSGSKGLKDKNIRPLAGKPLLWYTIDAAKQSGCFSEIMVSTDSKHYAAIAREAGAAVPFLRSRENSDDTASSWAVVREVLDAYRLHGEEYESFALLQPTVPLRSAGDIRAGYAMLEEKQAGAIVAVCPAEHAMTLYNTLPADHSFVGFIRDPSKYARQMEETYYRLNGALYISRVAHFYKHAYIYEENCYALVMPAQRSIDVDQLSDFQLLEYMMEKGNIARD